jgi:RNA polymerase sigma-70 factor, ECF subfamily
MARPRPMPHPRGHPPSAESQSGVAGRVAPSAAAIHSAESARGTADASALAVMVDRADFGPPSAGIPGVQPAANAGAAGRANAWRYTCRHPMSERQDERELLLRLLEDDPGAWSELVHEYSALLLGAARRVFVRYGFPASHHDAEDVVATVWQNLLAHDRRQVRVCLERGNLLPALYALTRNRAVDLIRRQRFPVQPLPDAVTQMPEPHAEAIDPATVAAGLHAVEALAPRERTVVRLFFLHGRTYRDIETLTGIPLNSIGPTLNRALGKLRQALART